nr:hypothetical protein [Tanacetum cinerariifolium]
MIRCKVMRTLVSVEIEIMLILRLPCCLSSSSVRCLERVTLGLWVFVGEGSGGEGESWVSGGVGWKIGKMGYGGWREKRVQGEQ